MPKKKQKLLENIHRKPQILIRLKCLVNHRGALTMTLNADHRDVTEACGS